MDFWDAHPDALDLDRDADGVLERGCLDDVRWLIDTYGLERIHAFFRDVWAPEVTARTRGFWRAFFEAENETWAAPPAFRASFAKRIPPRALRGAERSRWGTARRARMHDDR